MFCSLIGLSILVLMKSSTVCNLIDINHWAKYFQYFALGIIISKENLLKRIIGNKYIQFLTPILFFILFSIVFDIENRIILGVGRDIILRYLGLFMVISLVYQWRDKFEVNNKFNKCMSYIGTHSMEIYLLHFFFVPDLTFLHDFMVQDGRMLFDIFLSLIISFLVILCCIITYTFVGRNDIFRKYIMGKN